MSWIKGFTVQDRNPVTELIVMRRYKTAPISVEGMVNLEAGVVFVSEFREIWGIWSILQEEDISPFLRIQFCIIYHLCLHCYPCPRLSRNVMNIYLINMEDNYGYIDAND